ncbi:hypothetical protein kuro4_28110 [Gelria sp. Kuro-4]|nr:hypothetical protein kuro4_28110 [Gelria sp. Kuro-4]
MTDKVAQPFVPEEVREYFLQFDLTPEAIASLYNHPEAPWPPSKEPPPSTPAPGG